MDELYVAATLSILVLLISIIWFVKGKTGDYPLPPGPRGLPIVGYLPFLRTNLHHQLTELGHKYGPVYKLRLGNKLCVVISSPSIVKEVVRDQDAIFGNRDTPVAAFVGSYGGNAVVWSPHNSQWRSMRKLCVQEMVSKTNLELSYNIRRDEIRKTIRNVYSMTMTGEPAAVEIGELAFRTQLNVIMKMLWGATVEGEDAERIAADFRVVFLEITDLFGKPNVSDFYPFLAGLDIQGIKKQMEGYVQCVDRIFDEVIAKYKQDKLSRGDQINNHGKKDFLQILLELNEKGDSDQMSISESQVKAMLMDMVLAGTDGATKTIEWAMSELMNNPEAMGKVQKELSDVVGSNNIVEELHIPKLKYLEAVVKETQRLHSVAPFLVPRSPSQSTTVGGKYRIPKNTRIFINVSAIHRDPSIWDNPMKFDPERFIVDHHDDNNMAKKYLDYSGNNFHYLPFGSGRRSCVGIPLAERMMIYFLASFIHSFEWKLPEGVTELDMSGSFGIVLRKKILLVLLANPRLSDTNLYM